MARFNEKPQPKRNLAGGIAYEETKEMQLVSLLLTSFGDSKFYQTDKEIFGKLTELIKSCDKKFCARAIIYARSVFGMRSVTHFASSVLAKYISGESWASSFFDKVVYRVDDMTEIAACHLARKEKLSNAMKKGFASALGRFDEYQLAKYRGEGKGVKLVDIVNLCHPVESEKNGGAITKLVNGELRSFDTWESELSAVGSDVDKKKDVWKRLLSEKKLGYFALLRNLRNIIQLGDETLKKSAFDALINEGAIKKSMVLPFRFATAYEEMKKIDSEAMRYVSKACEISLNNVPKLEGKTLVALDVSGSMQSARVAETAALFAAVLLKTNDCDLITFSDYAQYRRVNTDDSLMTIKDSIKFACGGTNFVDIFEKADRKYDRIILLSDMQAWKGDGGMSRYHFRTTDTPKSAFDKYKRRFDAPLCKMYSFDLAGYGTMQLPERDVCCLAGFSDKIFNIMANLESDKHALIAEVEKIEL